jgi:hypothetical protein
MAEIFQTGSSGTECACNNETVVQKTANIACIRTGVDKDPFGCQVNLGHRLKMAES